jgi:hypothetical protein
MSKTIAHHSGFGAGDGKIQSKNFLKNFLLLEKTFCYSKRYNFDIFTCIKSLNFAMI